MALVFKGEDEDEWMVLQGKKGTWDLRGTCVSRELSLETARDREGGGRSAIELFLLSVYECIEYRKGKESAQMLSLCLCLPKKRLFTCPRMRVVRRGREQSLQWSKSYLYGQMLFEESMGEPVHNNKEW